MPILPSPLKRSTIPKDTRQSIPIPALAEKLKITPEDYLAAEIDAPTRNEYVQGEIYAMAGASDSDGHVTVNANLITLIKPHLRGSGCKPYITT